MSVITVDNTLTTQLGAKVKEANSFKKNAWKNSCNTQEEEKGCVNKFFQEIV